MDRIVRILVNLNTSHVDGDMLKAIGSAFFTDSSHTNYTVEQIRSVDDAYRAATRTLEGQIQPTIHELSGKIKRRLSDGKRRIMEYYDQTDSELNLKRDRLVGSGRTQGLKSIDDKLRLSEIERQRRFNEIEEKNALKISIMLFSASLISQTKIRSRYSVKRGKAERTVYVVWNPVLNSVEPLVCEICNCETTEIELCSNSHLGCAKCVRSCSVCGIRLCTNCGITECAVCGVPLCSNCKIVCENCGDVLCEKHVESCTCKEEKKRKAAERAEKRKRKKREAEEKAREEHIRDFCDILLPFSESARKYNDAYVRRHVNALDQDWKNLMISASGAVARGGSVKARAVLQQLDAEYPANAWVKANLVLSYKRLSQKISSLGLQAVRLAPYMALAHTALAYTHEKNRDFQAAIGSYEQVIKISGEDEEELELNALFRIGKIFYNRRDWWEAQYRWKEALSIDPNFMPARQALRQLYD